MSGLDSIQQLLKPEKVDQGWRDHNAAIVAVLNCIVENLKDNADSDSRGNRRIFQFGEKKLSLPEVNGTIGGRPIRPDPTFTYADLGLVAKTMTGIASRTEIDTSMKFLDLDLKFPIVANMTSIVSDALIQEVSKNGGVVCDTRAVDDTDQASKIAKYQLWNEEGINFIPTVGASQDQNLKYCNEYAGVGCKIILIDTAHGGVVDVVWNFVVKCIKEESLSNTKFIVGNFGNKAQVNEFLEYLSIKSGKNLEEIKNKVVLKIGIGPGAGCTTREVTGVVEPQASAVAGVATIPGITIIADGGFQSGEGLPENRRWGNFFKVIALSSHNTTTIIPMVGRSVAGVDESAGSPIYDSATAAIAYKQFYGDASTAGKNKMGKSNARTNIEGRVGKTAYAGPVQDLINSFNQAAASALSYSGAKNMEEFRNNATLQFVSASTERESKTRI
jgi:IMP dehydrogenase/GMP reductase